MNLKKGFILEFEREINNFFINIDKIALTFKNAHFFEIIINPMINIIKSLKNNLFKNNSNKEIENCELIINKLNMYKEIIDLCKKKGIEKFI